MIDHIPKSPFLYPILDTEISTDVPGDARKLIQAGVEILQLRAKNQTKREIYDLALELADLCSERDVLFLINDFVDVALVTHGSGVHLGQDDFPVEEARALLGNRPIGLSTHTAEQYQVAQKSDVNYIAIGPVYETTTKRTSNQVLGINRVTALLQNKTKPVVAIGGIRLEHFGELRLAGVDGIAMISELYRGGNIYDSAMRCQEALRKHEKI